MGARNHANPSTLCFHDTAWKLDLLKIPALCSVAASAAVDGRQFIDRLAVFAAELGHLLIVAGAEDPAERTGVHLNYSPNLVGSIASSQRPSTVEPMVTANVTPRGEPTVVALPAASAALPPARCTAKPLP